MDNDLVSKNGFNADIFLYSLRLLLQVCSLNMLMMKQVRLQGCSKGESPDV